MAGKKGENSKKVAGNARKADAAAKKAAEQDAKLAAIEDEKWSKGSKSNSKKYVMRQTTLPYRRQKWIAHITAYFKG